MTRRVGMPVWIAIGCALLASRAWAGGAGAISVESAWARSTASPSVPGAVYFTVRNGGERTRTLVGIRCARAERAEMHETVTVGELMSMRPVERVPLAPGARVEFAPGGLHVMLMGLDDVLEAGSSVALGLRFEDGEVVEVEAKVLAVGAAPPGSGTGHDHSDHSGHSSPQPSPHH